MANVLRRRLQGLRDQLAAAAQEVYDQWDQAEDEDDEDFDPGGICDKVSDALSSIVAQEIADVDIFEGGHDGDDHAWFIAQLDGEAYGVDIPPQVYESGGGYNWKKTKGVTFERDHVVIFMVPLQVDDDD